MRSVDNNEACDEVTLNQDSYLQARAVYKNLVTLGFMNMLTNSAFVPAVTLVSSRAGKTLGNITFSLNLIFSCLFSFISVSVMNDETSKKKAILVGDICVIGFAACNWYISYYTLIPGTVLYGVGLATTWIVSLIYVNKIARCHARKRSQSEASVISFFTGILVAFSVAGYIVGNATTSGILTILKSDDTNNNDTSNELQSNYTESSKECVTNDDALETNVVTANVLGGTIVLFSVLALLITVLILDNLEKHRDKLKYTTVVFNALQQIKSNTVSVGKIVIKKEMLTSVPVFFVSGMSLGFIFSSYTKTYVSECVGVHVVGYTVMLYGVGNTLSSFVSGKLLGMKLKLPMVLGVLVFHLAIMLFLIIWEREPILPLLLFVSSLWGICDGVWLTVYSSFASNFGEDTRHPFIIYRMFYLFGVGFNSLLALVVSVKMNIIILSILFLVCTSLHLIVTTKCSL